MMTGDEFVVPSSVPLTLKNAPRALLVECDGWARVMCVGGWTRLPARGWPWSTDELISRGATVLAWRKP